MVNIEKLMEEINDFKKKKNQTKKQTKKQKREKLLRRILKLKLFIYYDKLCYYFTNKFDNFKFL